MSSEVALTRVNTLEYNPDDKGNLDVMRRKLVLTKRRKRETRNVYEKEKRKAIAEYV